ncbi:hypothetical protein CkaCkLH20_04629 [Colletotrichum karsti]|uniref:DUF7872 domain-containing protein n=1 Tax=Colletotrichum karsti TaxID=1095194 RepID=A0A9P6LLQ7_9PEZI|nr:uncharacterized protein CkaCkLH20_04629 [Colletotrichum karsti]KAF9878053.1 hypothetical protein CkaCkLH20_04629 [Colletotrichum karsti]
MRAQQLMLALAAPGVIASPLPQDSGSGGSCTTEALNQDTWKKLGIEDYLAKWTTYNVSKVETNAIQNFASSFGAPNFFCGLDSFCNAGQPCSPVKLPGWYALVAVQNWNSYMNSLNTAITFASSIMSLTLPDIVKDFYPDPKDDVTELKTMTRVFAGALSIIPFTGPLSTAASVIGGTSSFISSNLKPPEPTDLFLSWSNVASSLGKVVQNWQSAVSTSFQTTIDAQVNVTEGIFQIIRDGKFLGTSRNVTQTDMQKEITRSLQLYTIGLALQAQRVFIWRSRPFSADQEECKEYSESDLCAQDSDGRWRQYILIQRTDHKNAAGRDDVMKLLTEKYGMKKEEVVKDVADCVDAAGGKQLTYSFGDMLPVDSSTKCIFNLQVCTDNGSNDGIITTCEGMGLTV